MRIFFLFLFALPLTAGTEMTITAGEQVSQKLIPDVMQGVLRYQETSRNADTIKKDLNAIVAEVKRRDPKGERCRGGGYRLSPRYSYKDQKQLFIGYSGVLSFECAFGSIAPYNKLTAAIDKVSAPGVKKTQGALKWVVSDKRREAAKEELRGKLIEKAFAQAKKFSTVTGSKCRVSTVSFGGVPRPVPVVLRSDAVMAEASVPTQSPLPSEAKMTVDASVVYLCTER